ncbi:hypothetical protein ATI61_11296 [Archangium gephyra]|uniref:Sialidase n=1 Tax=Archangium gephyra TaxID=48 RepID=A0AAC8Q5R6_9BACT|nr:hypothetical protein [Archangium gephyra]AKJ00833.1 putative sialidase [Archangium gephyra]REG26001.1 hypothetical protein ATI61_11296 [Archangium gephyra]
MPTVAGMERATSWQSARVLGAVLMAALLTGCMTQVEPDEEPVETNSEALVHTGVPLYDGEVALTKWDGTRHDLFVIARDQQVWHGWANSPSRVEGWERLTGPAVRGRPAAVAWKNGRIDVVAIDAGGTLWHQWYNGGWGSWEALGSGFIGSPTLASWSENRLDIFARRADGYVYHRFFGTSGWGSTWWSIGGPVASDPAAVSWGPDRIDLVATDSASNVWHTYYWGGWRGWFSLPGMAVDGNLAIASRGGNQLEIYGRVRDGTDRIFTNIYSTEVAWSGWLPTSLPAATSSGPGAVARDGCDQVVTRRSDGTSLDWNTNCTKGCGMGEGQKCCATWWCADRLTCGRASDGEQRCGACGANGQACCPTVLGGWCESGTGCIGSSCRPCGQLGQTCCPNAWGGFCSQGVCAGGACVASMPSPPVPSCGGQGQSCCNGMCNTGLACSGGVCSPCGGSGQACCPGSTCGSNLRCGGFQTCSSCGTVGAWCCPGTEGPYCNNGLTCHTAEDECY